MIETIPQHLQPVRDPGPYEPGRVCVHARCITRLHRNNPGPHCERHTPEAMAEVLNLTPPPPAA